MGKKPPSPRGKSRRPPSGALRQRFRQFSESASKFSREVAPLPSEARVADTAELNLQIAKAIFGKWSLEILVLLYTMKHLGFEQARKSLEGISRRVLSEKLKQLESMSLVQRQVLSASPPRVSYSLTEKGLIVAHLGEPVFLFLRHEQGLGKPS